MTYKYDETKLLADHLPFVNVVKPPVRRIVIHMNSAIGDEYGVQLLWNGSSVREIPCFFIAIVNRIWLNRIDDHDTRTPAAVKSTSHQNTVIALFDSAMNAKNMKHVLKHTQTYGTPQDVVRRKILGACPLIASP
jgi:hypothetical protein